ncbi:MAG: hypothetical protein DI534_11210 [Leifsonia xyli]|nr:MAG: hypothetical protein DI534_11210 [Leifsonia xyli]
MDVPFQPIRSTLYGALELLVGFEPNDPQSIASTPDFLSYRYFVQSGRAAPVDPYAGMMEALHDNSILRAMHQFLRQSGKPAAAIMGGHQLKRDDPAYESVARISKRLTESNFLMASGGGPGAMEATHLGALLRDVGEAELKTALKDIASPATLPATSAVVRDDGSVDAALVAQLHEWTKPAVALAEKHRGGGVSLAVPTWHYGHEPFSPLASHVAKYFQNSIREDVLLALAANGIIYAPGRAGTLQEVFQDAAQNYYRGPDEPFAPIVFFDKTFWEKTLPVGPLLRALFVDLKRMDPAEYDRLVCFTDDEVEAAQFLIDHQPRVEKTELRMQSLGFGPMLADAARRDLTM